MSVNLLHGTYTRTAEVVSKRLEGARGDGGEDAAELGEARRIGHVGEGLPVLLTLGLQYHSLDHAEGDTRMLVSSIGAALDKSLPYSTRILLFREVSTLV